jgi:hypothetical protein
VSLEGKANACPIKINDFATDYDTAWSKEFKMMTGIYGMYCGNRGSPKGKKPRDILPPPEVNLNTSSTYHLLTDVCRIISCKLWHTFPTEY